MSDPNGTPTPRDDAHDESTWTDAWADERWHELVADLQVDGSVDDAEGRPGPGAPSAGWGTFDVAPWVRTPGPRDWPASDEVEALEEAESHYQPPEPPPVLGRDPLKNLAWGAVAGVPAVLFVLLLVVRPFPRLVGAIGGVLFLAGIAVLVWRMPHERQDDDGPGAVV
ncbi:hypothetical protein [Luteimicrobium subarcticum]|uniref:DUF308 domain-containing protein n=1 Tax=Luteimicrobium subarcticum TaxID=620910 RepID=A0A2M8WRE0_9MICO|nr:hypothetical protein [Luteimicrobium subarcticum]PJI93493.1 hypothetical protein CLV34_2067 [Luteimicrobium subarcticum]